MSSFGLHLLRALAATSVLAAANALAAGTVAVRYPGQATYTDAGRGQIDREQTLRALTRHFQAQASRLAQGQSLQIEVLDLDLAGEFRLVGTQEFRILRGGVDWPRAQLRYTLFDNGKVIKSGEARVSDLNYMSYLHRGRDQGVELPFEKRMLDRWFTEMFVATR